MDKIGYFKKVNMRGNINWQVNEIYIKSGIKQIGKSKHKAKESVRVQTGQNKGITWHDMGKQIGIFSYATADAYRAVWKNLGNHVKLNFGVKNLEHLNGDHIKSFLEEKISNNVAFKTFSQYASALEKLETALNGFAENRNSRIEYDFQKGISESREIAQEILERFEGTRAYEKPKELINETKNDQFKLIAKIQYESGARISECNYLTSNNLMGLEKDPYTGLEKGKILIEQAKGGITGFKYVEKSTYMNLQNQIDNSPEGRFFFNMWGYREALKVSAA